MAKNEKNAKPAAEKTTKPAKAEKNGKAEKAAEEKPAKEAAPEFKYGVKDLAEALEIKPASVRVRLRNAEVPKAGKSYGWNTKAELQAVIDQLKSSKSNGGGDEDSDDEEDEDDE